MEECEELAKEVIEKHVVIQILLAFPKLSFEVHIHYYYDPIGTKILYTSVLYISKSRSLPICFQVYGIARRSWYFALYHKWVCIRFSIVSRCGDPIIGISSGTMLRQCIQVRCIHEVLLSNPALLEPLFTKYACDENFDISSDVFQCIHDLLRKNKQLVSTYLHPSKPLNQQVKYMDRWLGIDDDMV